MNKPKLPRLPEPVAPSRQNTEPLAAAYVELERRSLLTGMPILTDVRGGAGSSGADFYTNVNGTNYFVANDGVNGRELWKTDGTTSGTMLVKDIRPGAVGSAPRNLINVNGTLFLARTMERMVTNSGPAMVLPPERSYSRTLTPAALAQYPAI